MEVTEDIRLIAEEMLNRYKQEVDYSGHKASGDLTNTAKSIVKFDGKYFEIYFNLQEYWKYLENGTKPHFPPIDAIERWITVKHIIPSSNSGKVPTTKQLAFLIARSINRNGTKPTKLLQKSIDNSTDLIDALVDSIINQLQEEINKEEI